MITNEKGHKVAKLICVTAVNNNKYYNMTQINESEFEAVWGRVEGGEPDTKVYPMKDWDRIYRDKTKESKKPKPYSDVTHLYTEDGAPTTTTTTGKKSSMFKSDRAPIVVSFVDNIMKMAKDSVERNYTVSSAKVTKSQVDEAQSVLNDISSIMKVGTNIKDLNDRFIELYQIIPRKMKKVQDFLLEDVGEIKDKKGLELAKSLFSCEQDNLDVMAGQVAMAQNDKKLNEGVSSDFDILTSLNLEAFECSPAEIEMIKKKLGPNAHQFHRAVRVKNTSTEKNYTLWLEDAKHEKTDLLWHGSRNENWWSIFQQGLKIRPSNAVLTGAMFGNGVYFADKAQKSIGYTSYSGSYWAGGNAKTALLGLYEIHQGKQLEISKWDSEHSRLDEDKMKKKGFDSVFAKGGYDLRNNEFIVYNTAQSTVRYLIEIK